MVQKLPLCISASLFKLIHCIFHQIGDLGLALGEDTVRKMYKVDLGGTFTHIPPEGWADPNYKPDELGDIYMLVLECNYG